MDDEVLLCGYSHHSRYFYMANQIEELGCHLIRLQTEGACTVKIQGEEYAIEAGDLVMLEPGNTYEVWGGQTDQGLASSSDFYLFCRGSWVEDWWIRTKKLPIARIELDESILSLWRQLSQEKCQATGNDPELMCYLLRALCIQIGRALNETVGPSNRPYVASRMKRYIERHAYSTFRVKDVAKYVGLSVSRAVHFFKECYGKTMIGYALDIRLSEAADRMKYTTMSIEGISHACGFGSYTHFYKAFKKKYGISPALYRKRETK
jgi:AraC family transcriptional regulator of arabinose operon